MPSAKQITPSPVSEADDANNIAYTVVVPVFCEAESIVELSDRIAVAMKGMDVAVTAFEILFVDDGSTDETPTIIRRLCEEKSWIRAVTLRRNSGKSMALMAGFQHARGRLVITMDGDLQDNPEDIPILVEKLSEEYDLVSGWRQERQDQPIRKGGSKFYNWVVGWSTGLRLHDLNCGFKIYRKEVAEALCVFGQFHRYIPVQAHLIGFRATEAKISNSPRKYGASKYRTFRYQGLFDLLSILFTYKFGLNPLHFFGTIGLILIVPSSLTLAYLVGEHVLYWFGFGEEFALFTRPMLSLSLNVLLMGTFIFLTGFVCDLILHLQIRRNMGTILELIVSDVTKLDDPKDTSRETAKKNQGEQHVRSAP